LKNFNLFFLLKYFDQQWFWISYAIFHIIICFVFTTKIYYMNRLKFSFRIHVSLKFEFLFQGEFFIVIGSLVATRTRKWIFLSSTICKSYGDISSR
jgi:hypothetical protein